MSVHHGTKLSLARTPGMWASENPWSRSNSIVCLHDPPLRDSSHSDSPENVELKYFAGLTGDQIAELLKVSPATVDRDWWQ